jgi:hypothetical protein
VWGIDRGAGIELFPTLDPPTGEGVTFDAVVVLLPDGTGSLIDLVEGGVPNPWTLEHQRLRPDDRREPAPVPPAIAGARFRRVRVQSLAEIRADGVDPADNTQVSDFAPDASTFVARPPGPPTATSPT